MDYKIQMSPFLQAKAGQIKPQIQQEQQINSVETQKTEYNPAITQAVVAQARQILPTKQLSPFLQSKVGSTNENTSSTQQTALNGAQEVQHATAAQKRVVGYQNNLKEMLTTNKANIIAVIPRIMNSQDTDGNELIQGDEKVGTLVNAVERLDELKDLGFNTQHMLPIHPTSKTNAMSTAGSLYAPSDFLTIDPELVDENPPKEAWDKIAKLYEEKTGKKLEKMDKNDPEVAFAQCKYYLDECHKRNIKVMLDLPSCAGLDFSTKHPELMAVDANGKEKVPQGWQDIRMFKPFQDEQNRELNRGLLDMHKKYVDMCVELGFDGIRADVGRAKPVEFWNVIINYSHKLDPEFGWLAETYTHEDASPQLNMPYDRPKELLEVGFDSYYGQYHIFSDWTKANQLYDYVKENIELNNDIGEKFGPKSLIASMFTHDDQSPMLYGGAPWVMFLMGLQSMLPQVNPYVTDGVQTGDYYLFPYDHAIVRDTKTDNHECTVHTGRMDIFNNSRKPGGKHPEISDFIKTAFSLRDNNYNEVNKNSSVKLEMTNAQDVITKGSFIILPSNNPEIISFARHKDGKTLIFIGNRNVNEKVGGTIEIPGLKPEQKFKNLVPTYGDKCEFQNNKNGTINVELGSSRACIFEIDDKDIETLSQPNNVMQQKFLK